MNQKSNTIFDAEVQLLKKLVIAQDYERLSVEPAPPVSARGRAKLAAAFQRFGIDPAAIDRLPGPWSVLNEMLARGREELRISADEAGRWLVALIAPRPLAPQSRLRTDGSSVTSSSSYSVGVSRSETRSESETGMPPPQFAQANAVGSSERSGWELLRVQPFAEERQLELVFRPPSQASISVRVVAWSADAVVRIGQSLQNHEPQVAIAHEDVHGIYDGILAAALRPTLQVALPEAYRWKTQRTPLALDVVDGVLYVALTVEPQP